MPIIWDGHFTGLADSKFSGVANSFAVCVGIDGHSIPGTMQANQKLTKDSGSTVDALCRVSVAASNGYTFWFSYTSGKIWARASGGTWTLAYTTAPSGGGAGCLGAIEFNGYILWATESRLHRIAIANADDAWTAGQVDDDWQTLTVTDASFHPMVIQNTSLFIGDGYQVSKVTAAFAFTATALDIKTPHRIKDLIDFDIDILIGTFIHANVNKAEVLRWDTVSTSWQTSDPINENGVNCFIRDDNFVYAQCGQFGKIYYYDGAQLVPFKRIPGTWSPTSYGEVFPGSVATHLTMPVFGFSNGSGNPALQGVYRFGSYSKDYPKVLDLSFPISNSSTLQTLSIGAILAVGADLFVAWQDGSTYGVDKLDWSNKYASAYIETMVLTPAQVRHLLDTITRIYANYASLPASTDIGFQYKKDHGSFVDITTEVTDAVLLQKYSELSIDSVAAIQLKITLTVSSNNSPQIESIGYENSVQEL